MNVLALLVLAHQLAVTDDRQLIAVLETISIGFHESDFGAVDALFLDARQKFVLRAFMFLDELVPGRDFLVETGDVLERIVARNGPIEDAQKIVENRRIFSGLRAEPAVGFADLSVQRRGLIVFSQALQRRRFVELDDVAKLAAVFRLIIVQANQGGFHDVDAGDILRNREPVGVFFGETLEVLDDVEQIAGRCVAGLGRSRARRTTGAQQNCQRDDGKNLESCSLETQNRFQASSSTPGSAFSPGF